MLCAAMVAGTTILGLLLGRTQAPAAPASDVACATLRTVVATALYDRLAPENATPEDVAAIDRLNAELAMIRRQIEETC